MAYNVFKRPMFRKGGTPAQGTGIMSHVEPRVKAANGFPNFGASQVPINPETGMTAYETMLGNRPDPRRAAPQRIPYIKSGGFNFMTPTPAATTSTGPNTKQGLLSLSSNRAPVREIPYIKGAGFGFMKPGGRQSQLVESSVPSSDGDGYDEFTGMFSGVDEGTRFVTQDDGTIVDTKSGNVVTQEQITTILKEEKPKEKPTEKPTGVGKPQTKEEEIRSEAAFINKLLEDKGLEKAELALILAESLGTPGGFNKKLSKARELALPFAKQKSKQKKAVTLEAYKAFKEKEKYKTRYDQPSKTFKDLNDAAIAMKRRGDKRTVEEIRDSLYLKNINAEDTRVQQNILGGERANIIASYGTLIKQKEAIDSLDPKTQSKKIENLQKKYDAALKKFQNLYTFNPQFDKMFKGYREALGLKNGGRAKFANGTDPSQGEDEVEEIATTTVDTFGMETEEKPVIKLSYDELRNRLPKEINDQVVQLLSTSEEALQAFAYITTQDDVNRFNVKYGVNLIIPPTQA
jgi:hypothetical protein